MQGIVQCLSIMTTFKASGPKWQHCLECSYVARKVMQTYCACIACRHQPSFSDERQALFRHASHAEVLRSRQHNRVHPELAGKHTLLPLCLFPRCYCSTMCGTCLFCVSLCDSVHCSSFFVVPVQSPAGKERSAALASHACVALAPICHCPCMDQISVA